MTVYSRSDLAAISISPAHGGCGDVHRRPAPGGNPVPIWQLTCFQCEDFLRFDPLWAPTATSVPETPDELQAREAAEGRTSREQLNTNVDALSRIGDALGLLAQNQSNNQSPETAQLLAMLTAVLAHNGITVPPQTAASEPEPVPVADDTTDAPPDALVGLHEALARESERHPGTMIVLPPESTADAASEYVGMPDLDAMGLPALNDYAKALGLAGRRSKADQIAAIRDYMGQ